MQLPTRRWHLWRLPLIGAALGGAFGLAVFALFGSRVALATAVVAATGLGGGLAHVAWRCRFGARSWLVAAGLLAVLLLTGVALLGSGIAVIAGDPALGRRVAGLGAAALVVAAAGGAWLERRRLAARRGPWWEAVVDVPRRRVGPPLAGEHGGGGAGERLGVLAAGVGVNVPMALELAGYRLGQWLPWLAAALGAALLYVAWQVLGPLLARAAAVLALEAETGARFEHRDIERLEALRRGDTPAAAPAAAGSRALRGLRAALQLVAGLGFVGGATIAFVFAWPDWQQARDWAGFRRAVVVVTAVDVTAQHSAWVGQGTVDDQPVDFRPRELDAVLGRPPVTRQEALAQVRPRLPLRAEAWWNPQTSQRLLPPQASETTAWSQVRFSAGFALVLFAVGGVAWLLDRPLRRRERQALSAPPSVRPKRRRGAR